MSVEENEQNHKLWRATTIVTVRKGEKVVVGGDGQVSFGNTIFKTKSRKVRTMASGKVIAGFAGSAADGLALFERLEEKLIRYPSDLKRACVELARDWRTDKFLRKLEAMLIVVDKTISLILTGTGDVLEPDENVLAIGSGGNFAWAAAKALMDSEKDAEEIVRAALGIASDICIYTNKNFVIESLSTV